MVLARRVVVGSAIVGGLYLVLSSGLGPVTVLAIVCVSLALQEFVLLRNQIIRNISKSSISEESSLVLPVCILS